MFEIDWTQLNLYFCIFSFYALAVQNLRETFSGGRSQFLAAPVPLRLQILEELFDILIFVPS